MVLQLKQYSFLVLINFFIILFVNVALAEPNVRKVEKQKRKFQTVSFEDNRVFHSVFGVLRVGKGSYIEDIDKKEYKLFFNDKEVDEVAQFGLNLEFLELKKNSGQTIYVIIIPRGEIWCPGQFDVVLLSKHGYIDAGRELSDCAERDGGANNSFEVKLVDESHILFKYKEASLINIINGKARHLISTWALEEEEELLQFYYKHTNFNFPDTQQLKSSKKYMFNKSEVVEMVAISENGKWGISISEDDDSLTEIILWDIKSQSSVKITQPENYWPGFFSEAIFDPNSEKIALMFEIGSGVGRGEYVFLTNIISTPKITGEQYFSKMIGDYSSSSIFFSKDSKLLFYRGKSLHFLDSVTGEVLPYLKGHIIR